MRHAPLALAAALFVACAAWAAETAKIEPAAVGERLAWADRSLLVLDVRTPAEFAEGHVPGALNIPHTEIAARVGELSDANERDIVVYCRSGNRSALAMEALRAEGFTRLYHMQGDYLRWTSEQRQVTTAR